MKLNEIIKDEIQKVLFEFALKKNKWTQIKDRKVLDKLKTDLFKLIDTAYKPIGGHVNFQSPKDILDPELTFWEIIDDDDNDDIDAVLFGKNKNGIKQVGMGHNGTKLAKTDLLNRSNELLKSHKHWVEVSGQPALISINKYNVPVINNEETVRKLLSGKDINWLGEVEGLPGDGWYERKLGNEIHKKIIIGVPKI